MTNATNDGYFPSSSSTASPIFHEQVNMNILSFLLPDDVYCASQAIGME